MKDSGFSVSLTLFGSQFHARTYSDSEGLFPYVCPGVLSHNAAHHCELCSVFLVCVLVQYALGVTSGLVDI
jgi:hypothetical protein